jgi:glycosyltransferase involved in cell wall biosynthesis
VTPAGNDPFSPDVTVVMPTRNRAGFLRESVASVVAQRGASWELIIVDDGDEEATRTYVSGLADSRIRFWRNDGPRGQSGATTSGLRRARGEFVMLLDDDDLLRPRALERLVGALRRHRRAVAASGARWDWFCDGRGGGRRDSHPRVTLERDVHDDLLFGWSAVSGQNLYRTSIAQRVGGPDPNIVNVQDRDFWLRICLYGPVVLLPHIVMSYRVHAGQWKPPDVRQLREQVFRRAIKRLARADRRHGLRIRAAARAIERAEDALSRGRYIEAGRMGQQALVLAPRSFLSPLIGPWVARRLARRVWHRLLG